MALKDIVKGICSTTRCKYDVYTKEKTDELLETKANKSDLDSKFALLTGTITNDGTQVIQAEMLYPEGFNYGNCVVISSMLESNTGEENVVRWTSGTAMDSMSLATGGLMHKVTLHSDKIDIRGRSVTISDEHELLAGAITNDYMYKIVLMKID